MDEANNQSGVTNNIPREQNRSASDIAIDILNNEIIEEIVGFQEDDRISDRTSSSISSLSSCLLASPIVKKTFQMMMLFDLTNLSQTMIKHLFQLERKAFKWFGEKIPYAYFGIVLPGKIGQWSITKTRKDDVTKLYEKLKKEVDIIEHCMYTLSEQEKGDLGLMLPKKFIEARNDAIGKGLIKDHCANGIINLDHESIDPDGSSGSDSNL
jgi:hypothetical protein